MTRSLPIIIALAINIFIANPAIAQEKPQEKVAEQAKTAQEEVINKNSSNKKHSIFSFVYENDLFAGKDEGYTSGIRFAWMSSEEDTPKLIKKAAGKLPGIREGKKHISIAVGQNMYSPSDLKATNLIPHDQPYAGFLYTSLGVIADNSKQLNSSILTIGTVGPNSFAEQTQKSIHKTRGVTKPMGWDNQLENEPGLNFSYERKWKNLYAFHPESFGMDFTPDAGFSLGNINTSVITGGTVRIGYDLPKDFGPPRIRANLPSSDYFIPRNTLGGYFFVSTHLQVVARNIFLDGNTFEDGPHVRRRPIVADLQAGVAMNYKNLRFSYSHVVMTKEYYEQKAQPQYGSLSVSYRF